MNAQAITILPLMRPQFDNANLASRARWLSDNVVTLARYWRALGAALGVSCDADDDADLDCWLHVQYEIELARVNIESADPAPAGADAGPPAQTPSESVGGLRLRALTPQGAEALPAIVKALKGVLS